MLGGQVQIRHPDDIFRDNGCQVLSNFKAVKTKFSFKSTLLQFDWNVGHNSVTLTGLLKNKNFDAIEWYSYKSNPCKKGKNYPS